jgi:EpsD family peptidyl-prolyl cis-trans isomerase
MLDRLRPLAGTPRTAAILGICAFALVGCGKKDPGAAVPRSQVVAYVGDEVVTTQELENEFRWANLAPDKQKDPAIVKQVLNELVLRKYLMQEALRAKLDREPSVLLDLLRARSQVLATAYISRAAGAKPITQTEVDAYITNNPLKFADRKMLSSEQIVFAIGPNSQSIIDDNREAKSLDEIDQKLTVLGVPHSRSTGLLNSGDIPGELFNAIQAKKDDNVFFSRSGSNGVFFAVKNEEPRPLTGEAAANAARQILRSDRVKAEAGMASVSAGLEAKYEGEYATIMGKTAEPSVGGKN